MRHTPPERGTFGRGGGGRRHVWGRAGTRLGGGGRGGAAPAGVDDGRREEEGREYDGDGGAGGLHDVFIYSVLWVGAVAWDLLLFHIRRPQPRRHFQKCAKVPSSYEFLPYEQKIFIFERNEV